MQFTQEYTTTKAREISVLGCGWFGFAFAKELIRRGYLVKGSTTTEEKLSMFADAGIEPFLIDFSAEGQRNKKEFYYTDILFICIPPNRNSLELMDYPKKIEAIIQSAKKTPQIVMISSTSVYGDQGTTVDEGSEMYPETDSAKVVLEAENRLKSLRSGNGTIIRFAGLIGPGREPGRLFAGKTDVANGLAPVNLIHQEDAVGVACRLIEKEGFGRTYNACAPNHPTRKVFYRGATLAAGLEAPTFIEEKTSFKIVTSKNVPEFLDYDYIVRL